MLVWGCLGDSVRPSFLLSPQASRTGKDGRPISCQLSEVEQSQVYPRPVERILQRH